MCYRYKKFKTSINHGLVLKKVHRCIKDYLRYRTIFCYKVAVDLKNYALFLRHLDFRVFVKSTDFKICEVIIGIAT